MNLFWVVAILGAVAGGVTLFFTVLGATSAPQEAAGAALACAIVIIPYVLARSIYAISGSEEIRKQTVLLAEIARSMRGAPVEVAPQDPVPPAAVIVEPPVIPTEPTYFQPLPKAGGWWTSMGQQPVIWLLVLMASGAIIALVINK